MPAEASASIFQALQHAVVAVLPDGTILEANDAALRLLGYSDTAVRACARACGLSNCVLASGTPPAPPRASGATPTRRAL